MGRSDLERLSRDELIELELQLQRPEETSRTSSKPPATDRKERREQAKPRGAKPGHEGHSRVMSEYPDAVVEHRPDRCACCGGARKLSFCKASTSGVKPMWMTPRTVASKEFPSQIQLQ